MRQLFIYVDDSYSEIKEYFGKNKIQNIFRKADDAKIVGLFRQNVIKN